MRFIFVVLIITITAGDASLQRILRLAEDQDGPGAGSRCAGLPEVEFPEGQWSSVCSHGWSANTAGLLCSPLGCGKLISLYFSKNLGNAVHVACERRGDPLLLCHSTHMKGMCKSNIGVVCEEKRTNLTETTVPPIQDGQSLTLIYPLLVLSGLAGMLVAVFTVEVVARRRTAKTPTSKMPPRTREQVGQDRLYNNL